MSESTSMTTGRADATEPDSLTVTITRALADARGDDPFELPPLNDYIDVDALSRLFHGGGTGTGTPFGYITVHIDDHVVQVYHDGKVEVHPIHADRRHGDGGTK
jgi:hypothetical protein